MTGAWRQRAVKGQLLLPSFTTATANLVEEEFWLNLTKFVLTWSYSFLVKEQGSKPTWIQKLPWSHTWAQSHQSCISTTSNCSLSPAQQDGSCGQQTTAPTQLQEPRCWGQEEEASQSTSLQDQESSQLWEVCLQNLDGERLEFLKKGWKQQCLGRLALCHLWHLISHCSTDTEGCCQCLPIASSKTHLHSTNLLGRRETVTAHQS